MSIDTTPPENGFAPPPIECLTCYPANQTPQTVYMCVAGMKIGDLWAPPDPPPPNGPVSLQATGACWWTCTLGAYDFAYRIIGPFTTFLIQITGGAVVFNRLHFGLCKLWAANSIIVPAGQECYGGWCMVVPQVKGGAWSIPDLLELMSQDPLWAQWLNPRPDAAETVFYNLYDGPNRVNCKILIDHS